MRVRVEVRQPDLSVDSFEIMVDGERVGKPINGAAAKETVTWLRDNLLEFQAWWDLLGLMAEGDN